MAEGKKPTSRTREQARVEYEKQTKGLIFTKDFQTRQEAVMRDPLATVGERVMAWVLRRSWGEYVLYAMRDDGEPAFQVDCARALKLDKKSVSHAVAYLQGRGYLEDRPKLLYPVISPILATPPPIVKKSQEYATFYEDWKVAHSSDFEREEVARSALKEIRIVRLSHYKKWKRARKDDAAPLLETSESISETGQRAAVSPFEQSNRRHERAPAKNPEMGETHVENHADAAAKTLIGEVLVGAWGAALLPDDPIPGELLTKTRSLDVPVRALCFWMQEFAAKKASGGYPIDSPRLFVHAVDRDLPVWAQANRLLIESAMREEAQEKFRAEAEGSQSRAQAVAFLFTEIHRMQVRYPTSHFARPLVDPNDAGDIGLVNRILHELGGHSEELLTGYVVHVAAQFMGMGWGGARKAERAPGTPSGPEGLGLLVNWAKDHARAVAHSRRRQ